MTTSAAALAEQKSHFRCFVFCPSVVTLKVYLLPTIPFREEMINALSFSGLLHGGTDVADIG